MRNIIQRFSIVSFLLIVRLISFAQVTIAGPTCIIPGITYQYTFSATWDSVSTMQACVSGGQINDTANSACTITGAPLFSILVIWNAGISGSVNVTSTKGTGTISVIITQPLSPGSIDTSTVTQYMGIDSVPADILCAIDTGGYCSPAYVYQWQSSIDRLNWINAAGATSQNFSFDSALTQTTFYRRMVTETNSGSIAYSNIASVFVNPSDTTAYNRVYQRDCLAQNRRQQKIKSY